MSKGTQHRPIRIPETLWRAVQAKAASEGVNASGVVRDLLREWLASKHLTDPELAAELWCMETEAMSLSRDGYRSDSERHRADILYRFATLPHSCGCCWVPPVGADRD